MRKVTYNELSFVLQFGDKELQNEYRNEINKIGNQFHLLPHSQEHQKGFFIQFVLNGDIEDMPYSLGINIQKCCCDTYRQTIQAYFEERKQELINQYN